MNEPDVWVGISFKKKKYKVYRHWFLDVCDRVQYIITEKDWRSLQKEQCRYTLFGKLLETEIMKEFEV